MKRLRSRRPASRSETRFSLPKAWFPRDLSHLRFGSLEIRDDREESYQGMMKANVTVRRLVLLNRSRISIFVLSFRRAVV